MPKLTTGSKIGIASLILTGIIVGLPAGAGAIRTYDHLEDRITATDTRVDVIETSVTATQADHKELARDVKASNHELTTAINGLKVTVAELTAAVKHEHAGGSN